MNSERQGQLNRVYQGLALVLTAWGLLLSNITLSSGDYRGVITLAGICGALALILIVLAWRRMSLPGRVFFAMVAFVAALMLLSAFGEGLSPEFGW